MALSGSTVFEVRTGGSDTQCSGGFVAGSGTDYSQQNAAQFSGTDLVIVTTTSRVSSASHTFVTADIGNLIAVTAGVNFTAGIYQITSLTGGSANLDRAVGTIGATGGTWWEGGAFASPGKAGLHADQQNMRVWIKSGTYNITSTTANIAGGRVAVGQANQNWEGYNSTRGDLSTTRPVLTASGITSTTLFTAGSGGLVTNIDCNGASQSGISGFNTTNANTTISFCTASNCPGTGINSANGSVIQCGAITCGSGFSVGTGAQLYGCLSRKSTGVGFTCSPPCLLVDCISDDAGGIGFSAAGSGTRTYVGCVSYSSTGVGFSFSNFDRAYNCVAESNSTQGYGSSGVTTSLFSCASYGNSARSTGGFSSDANAITGSGSFFTNAASGDFSINNTAGAGALLRGTGIPQTFPGGLTTSRRDVGAAQHADPAIATVGYGFS